MIGFMVIVVWLVGAFYMVKFLEREDMTSQEKSAVILMGLFWPATILLLWQVKYRVQLHSEKESAINTISKK